MNPKFLPFPADDEKIFGLHIRFGDEENGGTLNGLNISWANGKCLKAVNPKGNACFENGHLVKNKFCFGSVYETTVGCNVDPKFIRIEAIDLLGGNRRAFIEIVKVFKATILKDEDSEYPWQSGVLCRATFREYVSPQMEPIKRKCHLID